MSSPKTTLAGVIAIILTIGAFIVILLGPDDSREMAQDILTGILSLAVLILGSGLMAARDNDRSDESAGANSGDRHVEAESRYKSSE